MGGETTTLTAADARHLLRRTGFGAKPADVNRLVGQTRGAAADGLLEYKSAGFKPTGRYIELHHDSWLKYMIRVAHPLQEKLVLFWHDHFATSYDKVGDVKRMANQNKTLRLNSKGNFRTLLTAINLDPAMLEFLDTVRNRAAIPNENYARELMELFTLGVFDFDGQPNYLQSDVVQIARAFTGWTFNPSTNKPLFDPSQHDFTVDFPARGPKVIFTSRGGFGPGGRSFVPGTGEGPDEITEVINTLLAHTDSEGQNTTARRITRRLLEFFCDDGFAVVTPSVKAVVDAIIVASDFASTWELKPLLREIFVHDAFFASVAAPTSIKWPVDYAVGTFRMLAMKPRGQYAYIDGGDYRGVRDLLTDMGQVVLQPPSVFGWDWELSWVNSATLLARYDFGRDVAAARGKTAYHLRPEKLISLALTSPAAIVDAVTDVLGVKDALSTAERDALIAYLTDGGAVTTLDLNDYDTRNRKLHGLFALVLQSPIYQLH